MVGKYGQYARYGELTERGQRGIEQILSSLQAAAQPALVNILKDPALQEQVSELRRREQQAAEQEIEARLKKWASVAAFGGVAFMILLALTIGRRR